MYFTVQCAFDTRFAVSEVAPRWRAPPPSFNADAAVLRDVQLLREALDCPSGRDPTQLAAHTASIHELVITQGRECTSIVPLSRDSPVYGTKRSLIVSNIYSY